MILFYRENRSSNHPPLSNGRKTSRLPMGLHKKKDVAFNTAARRCRFSIYLSCLSDIHCAARRKWTLFTDHLDLDSSRACPCLIKIDEIDMTEFAKVQFAVDRHNGFASPHQR
jgi:hypothetical protein